MVTDIAGLEKQEAVDTKATWFWPEVNVDLLCVIDEAYSDGVEKDIP